MQTRCHSVFEDHSSCAFFQDRWVATERMVNFAPLLRDSRCSGSAPTNPTIVTELRYMVFLLFSAPFSWGTQGRGLLLPKRADAFSEGPRTCWRGTGKAEEAKLPGAGISPKPCPRKCAEEKDQVPDSEISMRGASGRQPLT